MSSNKYRLKKSCGDKHQHKSKGAAEAQLRSLERQGEETNDMRAYPCLWCKYWHIGHKAKEVK